MRSPTVQDGHDFVDCDQSQPPTTEVTLVQSRDPNVTINMFRGLGCPLSLHVLAEPERFRFHARLIRIGPITMGDVAFGAPMSIEETGSGKYRIDIPIAGHKRSRHSGAEVVVRPDRAGVYRPFGPFSDYSPGSPRQTRRTWAPSPPRT